MLICMIKKFLHVDGKNLQIINVQKIKQPASHTTLNESIRIGRKLSHTAKYFKDTGEPQLGFFT